MSGPTISPEYAALNRQLHADRPDYGVQGASLAPAVAAFCKRNAITSLLDYGCGKGALKVALTEIAPELEVLEYDPAMPGKDTLPTRPVDLVVSLDVMEHIEPTHLDSVLTAIHGACAQDGVLEHHHPPRAQNAHRRAQRASDCPAGRVVATKIVGLLH